MALVCKLLGKCIVFLWGGGGKVWKMELLALNYLICPNIYLSLWITDKDCSCMKHFTVVYKTQCYRRTGTNSDTRHSVLQENWDQSDTRHSVLQKLGPIRYKTQCTTELGPIRYNDTVYYRTGTNQIQDTVYHMRTGTKQIQDTVCYRRTGTNQIQDTVYYRTGTNQIQDTVYYRTGTNQIQATVYQSDEASSLCRFTHWISSLCSLTH